MRHLRERWLQSLCRQRTALHLSKSAAVHWSLPSYLSFPKCSCHTLTFLQKYILQINDGSRDHATVRVLQVCTVLMEKPNDCKARKKKHGSRPTASATAMPSPLLRCAATSQKVAAIVAYVQTPTFSDTVCRNTWYTDISDAYVKTLEAENLRKFLYICCCCCCCFVLTVSKTAWKRISHCNYRYWDEVWQPALPELP